MGPATRVPFQSHDPDMKVNDTMRILIAATPGTGHVNPILAATRILLAAGHQVVVTTASAFRDKVEATGARFVALPAGADMDLTDIDRYFPERKALPAGPAQLAFDFQNIFIDTIPAQFAGLEAILQDFDAQVILADTMFAGCLPFLLDARAHRPMIASLGITCLMTRRSDGAPAGLGLPPAGDEATALQYAAIAAEIDTMLMTPARQRVDGILERLGAKPLPLPFLDAMANLPDVFLQPSVPGFEFPCMERPTNLHFIGALPGPDAVGLSSALLAAVTTGKHVVLVTQGTVANHDLGQLIGPTLAALAERDDVFVLVATGGRPASAIPVQVPGNALVAEFLPFEALMPHLDVLVTNGGYGGVTQAISHGVPLVAAGTTEDKPDVNARVAWAGIGVDLRTDTPDVDQLRTAIDTVLGDANYRARAQALAQEYGTYDAAVTLCALLENAVERHG